MIISTFIFKITERNQIILNNKWDSASVTDKNKYIILQFHKIHKISISS